MPKIFITNKSGHPQTFEVHGWNNNQNLTVKPHSTSTLSAPDKTSGAIIALHQGHEGEQAEITFNGFGGNDFFDMSNIVGAGGNMTIQQQGEPSTRKGDPLFMQNLRGAWKKASQQTKNDLKGSIFLDKNGNVERMGPVKGHPNLEKFVRSFADGKTYIGEGAWKGSPGVKSDNDQSSAGKGTKNSIITYSDGDATPDNHQAQHAPIQQEQQQQQQQQQHVLIAQEPASAAPSTSHEATEQLSAPKPHDARIGIDLHNSSSKPCTYYFYDNYWNGNGTAGANFDHPLKNQHLAPHTSHFVPLPASFKGRVQRGQLIPATWVEFQCEASNDHFAHGDISLQQGCDGAATIKGSEGTVGGFSKDIITHAPAGAKMKRSDGVVCLASTMGNWLAGPNEVAAAWEMKEVGQRKAYIKGGTGTDDIMSKTRRFEVVFY
ncbi:MAG: hypothetical protein L6R40_003595 [Gallowayella cf. fulva]|nr:MAG: hypothetical protein L6R40_003595 [Xanthomendoza cf. fulva]